MSRYVDFSKEELYWAAHADIKSSRTGADFY